MLIQNVYLLAVPTDASNSTPEEDEARVQAVKQDKLENADMLATQPGAGALSSEDEAKNESFTTSLVTKIVDNLQIEVRLPHLYPQVVSYLMNQPTHAVRFEIFMFDTRIIFRFLVTLSPLESPSLDSLPSLPMNSGNLLSLIIRLTAFTNSPNSNPSPFTLTRTRNL